MSKKFKINIIVITIIISIFACGYAIGRDKATKETWQSNRHTQTIIVKKGDTLWNIAEEYKPNNVYILEYIDDIKQLNGITNSTIHEGDTILVYVY